MENPDALISLHPQAAKVLIHRGNLKALLILVAAIIAGGHDIGHELVESRQRTDKPAVLSVAKAALICTHSVSRL